MDKFINNFKNKGPWPYIKKNLEYANNALNLLIKNYITNAIEEEKKIKDTNVKTEINEILQTKENLEKTIDKIIKELSGQTDEYEKKYKEIYIAIIKELEIDKIFKKSADNIENKDMQRLLMKSQEKFNKFYEELKSRTKKYEKEVPEEEINLLKECKIKCGNDLKMIHHYVNLFFENDYSSFCNKIKQAVKNYHPLMNLDGLTKFSKEVDAELKRLIKRTDENILKLSNDIKKIKS